MGIGMTIITSASQSAAVLKFARSRGHDAWVIGEVVKGRGKAKVI